MKRTTYIRAWGGLILCIAAVLEIILFSIAEARKGYDTVELCKLDVSKVKSYESALNLGADMTVDRFIQICYTDELEVIKIERDGKVYKIFCNSADYM